MSSIPATATRPMPQLRSAMLLVFILGTIICSFGFLLDKDWFYTAYLTAYVYWLNISLGCLAVAAIHGMTGGAWSRPIRAALTAGHQTMPLMLLLFLPLWFGAPEIYDWANPEYARHLVKKAAYLNLAAFRGRAVVYFGIWIVLSACLTRYAVRHHATDQTERELRLQRVSGLSFMAYGFTSTLASVDWMMSLEPQWYSTMFGLVQIAGDGVAGLSFAVLMTVATAQLDRQSQTLTPSCSNDLASMLFAAILFWAYCSFFQFLIVWSGNMPEENIWYVRRLDLGWQYMALFVLIFHFVVPFFSLLNRPTKRNPQKLACVAALLLLMRYADLYWTIVPGFHSFDALARQIRFHWLDPAALIAIGAVWLAVFFRRFELETQSSRLAGNQE